MTKVDSVLLIILLLERTFNLIIEFEDSDNIEFPLEYCVVGCTFHGYIKDASTEDYSEALEIFYKWKKELEETCGGSVTIYLYDYNDYEEEHEEETLIKMCVV